MADLAHVNKTQPTRYADINKPECEQLTYKVLSHGLERPSSITWYIECPYCFSEVKAYLWSLCGGGKRCGCGALMGSHGTAYKLRAQTGDRGQQ